MAISVFPVPNAPLMIVSRRPPVIDISRLRPSWLPGAGAGKPAAPSPALRLLPGYEIAAASAIELNFVWSESAREVRTTGALAPTRIAASGLRPISPMIL